MADYQGQIDLRSTYIDRLVKGFADEALILKNYVTVTTTPAREVRWYKKTAGFLDTTDTSGITASRMIGIDQLSQFEVIGQSWTKTTSYVRKFGNESETLSIEDIKDNVVSILATTVRDLTLAVSNQVDRHIYDILGEATTSGTPNPTTTNTAVATADGWDDAATGDPIKDLLYGIEQIRSYRYDPMGAVLYIHPTEYSHLVEYLISTKGSSIPSFSSQKVESGSIMEILGLKVVVSLNATTDYAVIFVPSRAVTYHQFIPLQSAQIDDPGIGVKIRVWEEGIACLTDPRAVHWITDTVV